MKKLSVLRKSNLFSIICVAVIAVSLWYLTVFNRFDTPIAYVLYLLMTFCLVAVCIRLYNIAASAVNAITDKCEYIKVYRADSRLRYRISLFISLVFNLIYVIFKLAAGIYFGSLWLISFALYYFILFRLRITIAKTELKAEKTLKDEYAGYRKTGITLLFINVFLTFVILIIVNGEKLKSYNDVVAISVACYTFAITVNSIVTLIKQRRQNSPLMRASKAVSAAASLMSMLSLEIIMLSTFGPQKTEFNEVMIMATGGITALIIIAASLFMIKAADFDSTDN